MPLTLAVDCAMRWLNLGLASPEGAHGEENRNAGARQSELLPRAVEGFLSRCGVGLRDLGRIAVTVGPGYYTGIRVGVAYATALAESLGLAVVPVGTLYALASGTSGGARLLAPVIRARRNALYGALYEAQDGGVLRTVREPAFFEADDFAALLTGIARDVEPPLVVGCDALEFGALQGAALPILPKHPAIGLALAVASLGLPAARPDAVRATYLREPD